MRNLIFVMAFFGSLPAHAYLDDQNGCGFQQTPKQMAEKYCHMFETHPLVRNEPKARAAKEECIQFYEHVATSINLMCSYRLESQLLEGEFQRAVAATNSEQQSLVDTAQNVLARAQKLQTEFLGKLEPKYNALEKRNLAYHDRLRDLAGLAGRTFANESTCLKPESEAPSLALMGLATIGHKDRRQTFETLQKAMNDEAHAVDETRKENREISQKLKTTDLTSIMPEQQSRIAIRDQGEPGAPRRNPGNLVQALVIRNVFIAGNRMVTGPTVRVFFPDAHAMGVRLVGMEIVYAYRNLKNGGLDWLDIVSVGMSVFSGSSAGRGHLIGTLAQTVEWGIRRVRYDFYVARRYAHFAKRQLEGDTPDAKSHQLARAFVKETEGKYKQGEQCLSEGN